MAFAAQFCTKCGTPAAPAESATGLTNYTRVRQLYDQAVMVGPPWNDSQLDQMCGGNKTLVAELRGMLSVKQGTYVAPPPPQPDGSYPMAPAPPPPPPGSRQQMIMIGPYRVLRELGRGGMGVAPFLATRDDGTFRKNVALKLLLREHVNEEFIQRFKQERQVLAALDHPNIARILDGGDTPDGAPYYVMDYIEGVPIDVFCDQQRLSLDTDALRRSSKSATPWIICTRIRSCIAT